MNKTIYDFHADACKTLANPKRLEIINILRDEELSVTDIVKKMNLAKANVSQHLSIMRKMGILETRRSGQTIYYKISSIKVITACDLMRDVLTEHFLKKEKLLIKMK